MATEKLKVFVNTAPSVSTSAITNVTLKATSSSEQAVLKTISYEAVDPMYPVTVSVTNGNAALTTPKTTKATVKNSDTLSGSQILDVSNTVSIKYDTGANIVTNGYQNARYFDSTGGIFKWVDSTSGNRDPSVAKTYDDTVGKFSAVRSGSLVQKGRSAFGLILDANNSPPSTPAVSAGDKVYFACYNNSVKAYNEAGALITWNTGGGAAGNEAWDFTGPVNGTCTDGTYIYGKMQTDNAILYRKTIVGLVEDTITMSMSFVGQNGNGGGFTLYHDGFLYSHETGSGTYIYKVNVTTGATVSISGNGIGSYSAGAVLTKAHNGKFYIIEVGQYANNNNIIDLETFTRTSITSPSLGTSTEYGNVALEVAPGVALFFYTTNFIWIDVNTMTASSGVITPSSYGLNTSINSNSDASSIANIPLHTIPGATVARSLTHKVYCDGVIIEGVE